MEDAIRHNNTTKIDYLNKQLSDIHINQVLQEAEKKGINRVKIGNTYIDKVTCEGVGCYIDLKVSNTYGLTLSELIQELHSMRVGYGSDVEVKCMGYKIL